MTYLASVSFVTVYLHFLIIF